MPQVTHLMTSLRLGAVCCKFTPLIESVFPDAKRVIDGALTHLIAAWRVALEIADDPNFLACVLRL